MSSPANGDLPQMPTTTESVTSTVVGATSHLPTIDSKIDGLPSTGDSGAYALGLNQLGVPQETIDASKFPSVIPPSHPTRKRTLVVCFDGTGDQFDNDNSNIVQLVALMKKDDRHQQLVYYQACVFSVSRAAIIDI